VTLRSERDNTPPGLPANQRMGAWGTGEEAQSKGRDRPGQLAGFRHFTQRRPMVPPWPYCALNVESPLLGNGRSARSLETAHADRPTAYRSEVRLIELRPIGQRMAVCRPAELKALMGPGAA
jgi:hypothetical protein